jgi:hypothetical protein
MRELIALAAREGNEEVADARGDHEHGGQQR